MKLFLDSHTATLYDSVDDPLISRFRWYVARVGSSQKPYVFTRINGRLLAMHRLILLESCKGKEVDHINGDGLDNRRENLRVCTRSQNLQNTAGFKRRKSPFKGVSKVKKTTGRLGGRPWEARICVNHKQWVVGLFKSPEEAAKAYDQQARIHHRQFARFNFPNPGERGLR